MTITLESDCGGAIHYHGKDVESTPHKDTNCREVGDLACLLCDRTLGFGNALWKCDDVHPDKHEECLGESPWWEIGSPIRAEVSPTMQLPIRSPTRNVVMGIQPYADLRARRVSVAGSDCLPDGPLLRRCAPPLTSRPPAAMRALPSVRLRSRGQHFGQMPRVWRGTHSRFDLTCGSHTSNYRGVGDRLCSPGRYNS